jgi:hypothetical protein
MLAKSVLKAVVVLSLLAGNVWGADLILNEYNAVDSNDFLGGGTAVADESGGRASDSHFGRVPGNGGDWFELVVIKDHLDIRGWQLDLFEDGVFDETLVLTASPIWKDLRAGTIITVSEDLASDISYNPAAGDWWINVQANNNADGLYIEKSSFPVSSKNWQLVIRNLAGAIVFGPAGEGVSPAGGVGGDEVFRLEDNPSDSILPNSPDYDDGDDFSTFGAPNRWGAQSFDQLRAVVTPAPAAAKLVTPSGAAVLVSNRVSDVRRQSDVVAEGAPVDSSAARVRVSSGTRPAVLIADGAVNFSVLALLAATWLH